MKVFTSLIFFTSITSAITFTLDLTSGSGSTTLPAGVTWYQSLSGSGSCGKFGTLKIDMTGHTKIKFDFTFGTKTGWLVNIGDSRSNNGWGGDGATQSRDCEAQISGDGFSVYKNDMDTGQVYARNGVVNSNFSAIVADGFIAWNNLEGEFDYLYDTNLYYAFNGQYDCEGRPNKDLYLGLNQVVNGHPNRRGSGLCTASLTFDSW